MIAPGANDVSIWCLDLARIAFAPMRALLSPDELSRADRFTLRGDQERFVKSRAAVRRILGERIGLDPRALVFVEGDGRKPALRDHPSVQFNLSHSGDIALIAAGATPLGVDIEAIKPDTDWRALAQTNFHADERAILTQHSGRAGLDAFFQLWTHKEAFLKATGIGLTDRLTSINVPLAGGRVAAPKALAPAAWYATPLDAPPGYKASLVTRQARPRLRNLTPAFSG